MTYCLSGLVLCLLLLEACIPTQDHVALFIQANAPKNMSARSNPTIMRARFVKIDFGLLEESVSVGNANGRHTSLSVNLFDDTVYQAILDSLEQNAPEGFVWIGHLDGVEYSKVTLVVEGNVMSGNITMPGSIYQIRYVGKGIHAIYQIDQSAFPPEEPALPTVIP